MAERAENVSPTAGVTPAGTAWVAYGQGHPLVLIHGVGMSHAVWTPQVADLTRIGRVICYDMLGHGGSRLPPENAALDDFSAQLQELMDTLEIDQATLIGHSMGALVSLQYAIHHPERVRSLVALNAVYRRTPEQRTAVRERAERLEAEGVEASLENTLQRWFNESVDASVKDTRDQVRDWLLATHPVGYPRAYRVFAEADEDIAGVLPSLEPPALFMTGQHDPNSSPAMSRTMAETVKRGHVQVLPGARHMMAIESAQEVNQRICTFIDAYIDDDQSIGHSAKGGAS